MGILSGLFKAELSLQIERMEVHIVSLWVVKYQG